MSIRQVIHHRQSQLYMAKNFYFKTPAIHLSILEKSSQSVQSVLAITDFPHQKNKKYATLHYLFAFHEYLVCTQLI